MKKWLAGLSAVTAGFCVLSTAVHAETYPTTATNWQVTFTGNALQSNFTTATIQESIHGMQPGDDANFEIHLSNNYSTAVDWYMENKVFKSFEDTSVAKGGAYSYDLTYYPTSGAPVLLYTSNTVGGEGAAADGKTVGLYQATDALDEYLYLEQIPSGGRSRVLLHVKLDGETQINSYQDTEAALQIDFAVELPETIPDKPNSVKPSSGTGRRIIYVPNTSDPYKAMPYFITGLLSLILFVCSAYLLWRTRDEK